MSSQQRRTPLEIKLNVYDLSKANDFIGILGFGAFHTGIVIQNKEWTFGQSEGPGSGVFSHVPKGAHDGIGVIFRQSITLGSTLLTSKSISQKISQLSKDWPGSDYDIVTRNCNHFSEALCATLLGPDIQFPSWINRLASLGSYFKPCLPFFGLDDANTPTESTVSHSDPLSSSSTSTESHTNTFSAFSGQGRKLGG